MQDVSLQIYRRIRQLREPRAFRAWTFRVATRAAFIHLRRVKRWCEIDNDPELATALAGVTPAVFEAGDAGFAGLIECVSPASRAVLLLHYQEHLSLDETAAILDIPLGTVKSRVRLAMHRLRSLLGDLL